jgi:hypothetical protein
LPRTVAPLLPLALLVAAACAPETAHHACTSVKGPGALVRDAALFRLDVYGADARCDGTTVAAGAGMPEQSQTFAAGQPITLAIPPGTHALVLTSFADASGAKPLGQGCLVEKVSAGARDCFDLTLQPFAPVVTPSQCAQSGLLLCDGFEGNALDARWSPYQISGFAGLDSTRAYRGSSSLHAHLDPVAGGGNAHGTVYTHLLLPTPDLYTRSFVWLPSSVTTVAYLTTLVQQNGPFASMQLILENGSAGSNNTTGTRRLGTVVLPAGRWFCLEWQVHFDPSAGYSRLWLDGQPITLPAGTEGTWPSPFYYYLRIGLESSVTTPLDAWIDELAADSKAIGCTR